MIDLQVQLPENHELRVERRDDVSFLGVTLRSACTDRLPFGEEYEAIQAPEAGGSCDLRCRHCGALAAVTVEEVSHEG